MKQYCFIQDSVCFRNPLPSLPQNIIITFNISSGMILLSTYLRCPTTTHKPSGDVPFSLQQVKNGTNFFNSWNHKLFSLYSCSTNSLVENLRKIVGLRRSTPSVFSYESEEIVNKRFNIYLENVLQKRLLL